MRSENFELLTDGSERAGRRVLNHFEQVRSFFRQTLRQSLTPQHVRIVQFTDEGNYRHFRASQQAAAFYVYGAGIDTVVMGPRTSADMTVAVHEYVHVLIRHSGLLIPRWLNEGIAEVYSTVTPVSGKMQVGSPPEGRMRTLMSGSQMPLRTLFSADHDSPELKDSHGVAQFYAKSWALAHILMLADGFRERFDGLVRDISDGAESEAAIRRIYGLTPDQLEDKLVQYLRMPTINVARFAVQSAGKAEVSLGRPAEPYEYEVALAHIEAATDKTGPAIERCKRLKQSYPSRPEPSEALAYLHIQRRETEPAVALLAEALERGSTSRQTFLHFLRMAPAGHPMLARAEGSASKWLEHYEADMEVRLTLARRQLTSRRYSQARATLAQVTNIRKKDAADYFRVMAHAAVGEGDAGEAAIALRRLKEHLPEDQQSEAVRLQSAIDSVSARAAWNSSAAQPRARVHTAFPSHDGPDRPTPARESSSSYEPEPETGPPVIRRVETQPAPAPAAEPVKKWRTPDSLPAVTGEFEALECSGARAAMLVRSSGRILRLWVDNPLEIEMKNSNGASMVFTCGKQIDLRRVVIQYERMPEGRAGDGLVRSILFP